MLFHITPRSDWEAALAHGVYAPASLAREGFIHLSSADQWPRTLKRWFPGREGLVLLTIDPTKLSAEVRYEAAHDELFPHLHGPLELSSVVVVTELVLGDDGTHRAVPSR